ncbi:MAG: hypothetical protein PHH23_03585 [Paludibacteraceae bacterium]|jgi:hypothetical protein|nr:hypothetical protein [Paludibacteraceae bacterium]
MEKKITVFGVIGEGFVIGMKNALSLLGAIVLYVLTIWVPYINVGTTIAMCTIPIELAKGNVISPLFIFKGQYRRYIGEFFTLYGMMFMALIPALLFLIVPGIVVALGWSLALYLLLDKGIAPGEAMVKSNKATYGYKWTIFGVSIVVGLAVGLVGGACYLIDETFGIIMNVIISLVVGFGLLGCDAVIYRDLTADEPSVDVLEETVIETNVDEGEKDA